MVEKCPTCGMELSLENLGEAFKHVSKCGMDLCYIFFVDFFKLTRGGQIGGHSIEYNNSFISLSKSVSNSVNIIENFQDYNSKSNRSLGVHPGVHPTPELKKGTCHFSLTKK